MMEDCNTFVNSLDRRHFIKIAASCATTAWLSVGSTFGSTRYLRLDDPEIICPSPQNEANPVRLPDGTLRIYYMERNRHVAFITSHDNGFIWSEPKVAFQVSGETGYACRSMVDQRGRVHLWFVQRGENDNRLPGNRQLDIWYNHMDNHRWATPRVVWKGYCGALRDAIQLENGRMLLPFGAWKTGSEDLPADTGDNYTTLIYSDDGGRTWSQPPAALTSPVYAGYNGNNYGACEPCITVLPDGKIWMLIRTQTGALYESFSENGISWTPAQASRFTTSNSPAAFVNPTDGRIVVLWNNHQLPPRVEGQGVYGGRDALHAAITDDGGETWHGFREVYLDPTRNESPPRSGDRGTAYPNGEVTKDGYILLTTGQGERARTILRFHPDWLYERRRQHNFTDDGLETWSVYKSVGPAQRWWRDRIQGARLSAHPDHSGKKVLHVRRADEHAPDGATWNFPAGAKGTIALRLRLNAGFGGVQISLADRLFDPTDNQGEDLAVFKLRIDADGQMREGNGMSTGTWHNLRMAWDVANRVCKITADNGPQLTLPLENPTINGISYVRLRSISPNTDKAGILLESVSAEVEHM